MSFLNNLDSLLNPPQKKAVETVDTPLLILAGAGSGKTRVLTYRMAYIIAQSLAAPDQILCVTFTNKAAKEMEHRIYKLLSELGVMLNSQLWVSTFHSFCVRVLREYADLLDYKKSFTIYDSGEQLSQIKKVMNALNINDKMFPAKNFQARISNAKMLGLTPDNIGKASYSVMDPKSLEVYKFYEAEMKKSNCLDFDDLLLKTHELFKMYPDLLSQYQDKFKYIMVDEYQDTNHIQYLLVKMLAESHHRLCVVGDEDQSIYSWRGADISNILNFEKDFLKSVVVKLEENYRSSSNIVTAATHLIKNNNERKDKTLFTNNPPGELIKIREEKNEYDEAKFVARTIQTMITEGKGSYNDYAVFYRTNAQSRVLEEQLRTLTIPYRLIGGVKFYDRMEIKDIISYMKVLTNPTDDLAVKRIINVPARGIGKTTVEKIEDTAMTKKITLLEAINTCILERTFNSGTTSKLRKFLDLIEDFQGQSQRMSLTEIYHIILDRTEYVNELKKQNTPEAEARIENLEEFDNAINQFMEERGEESTLQSFLEEMALVSDSDDLKNEINAVTLMTLHVSKGLEFPYVFIVGLEENLFPSARAMSESEDGEVEEERRLAYVGMTRARVELFLSYVRVRKVWGSEQMNPPSRFIQEIPKALTQFKSTLGSGTGFVSRFGSSSSFSHNNDFDDDDFSQQKSYSKATNFKKPFSNSQYDSQAFPDYDGDGKTQQYKKGMSVKHPTFGVGSIYSIEGAGDQTKVSVLFRDNTIKKFVIKYARLEIL